MIFQYFLLDFPEYQLLSDLECINHFMWVYTLLIQSPNTLGNDTEDLMSERRDRYDYAIGKYFS